MKLFIITITLVCVGASPQKYPDSLSPYPARGWRPSGPPFPVPSRQQLLPKEETSSNQSFGVPAEEYGPPNTTTEVEGTTSESPVISTTSGEFVGKLEAKENLEDENKAVTEQGLYYVYHPSGLLQKIVYLTKKDEKNMAYTAQIKYENVEPIRAPIYTYDPTTLLFQKLQL